MTFRSKLIMRVVVAFRNPAKVRAVREAFSLQFLGQDIEYTREGVYTEALVIALVLFVNSLFEFFRYHDF
jgi:non-canonical (house-cleaning) NTP pyrophosphatase